MFCQKCGTENGEDCTFCTSCGRNLFTSSTEKVYKNNTYDTESEFSSSASKQICLVCKGKGRRINKLHLTIGLILGLIVFPILAATYGGTTLVASAVVLFWGFSKKVCKTCDGAGYLVMH